MTMLSPNPSDRFGRASEVIKMLQEVSILKPAPQPPEAAIRAEQPGKQQSLTPKNWILSRLTSKALFLVPLAAVALLGSFWGVRNREASVVSSPPIAQPDNAVEAASPLSQRFSQGEKVLISQTTTPEKELATAAGFGPGDLF